MHTSLKSRMEVVYFIFFELEITTNSMFISKVQTCLESRMEDEVVYFIFCEPEFTTNRMFTSTLL